MPLPNKTRLFDWSPVAWVRYVNRMRITPSTGLTRFDNCTLPSVQRLARVSPSGSSSTTSHRNTYSTPISSSGSSKWAERPSTLNVPFPGMNPELSSLNAPICMPSGLNTGFRNRFTR